MGERSIWFVYVFRGDGYGQYLEQAVLKIGEKMADFKKLNCKIE